MMRPGDKIRIFKSGEVFEPGNTKKRLVCLPGALGTIIDMQPQGVSGGALVAFPAGEYLVPYAMLELAPDEVGAA